MSLRKLLLLFFAPESLRIRTIRTDIRRERDKALGEEGEGGDFYVPFWADAKAHMFGLGDLHALTQARIDRNLRRKRLYEAAESGFLGWWDDKRRWRNEPIQPTALPTKAKLHIHKAGVVKIDNVFALDSGPNFHRLIYPYFGEKPSITKDAARLGLWALSRGLGSHHDIADMRLLDVQRGASFGIVDAPLRGDEEETFGTEYADVVSTWQRLEKEY